jgi:copper chaperone CopZ
MRAFRADILRLRHGFLSSAFAGMVLSTFSIAAEKPKSAQVVFDVAGLECPACVYSVYQSIKEAKGVSDVDVIQTTDGYAKVTYDPQIISEQQVAQALREAYPLHGTPYLIGLRLRVPDFAKPGFAAKVDAVFTAWTKWLEVKPLDPAKGEFRIHFKPLESDGKTVGPKGWNLAQLTKALTGPAPEGLGLEVTIGQPAQ